LLGCPGKNTVFRPAWNRLFGDGFMAATTAFQAAG
jgi:hypothetical protein